MFLYFSKYSCMYTVKSYQVSSIRIMIHLQGLWPGVACLGFRRTHSKPFHQGWSTLIQIWWTCWFVNLCIGEKLFPHIVLSVSGQNFNRFGDQNMNENNLYFPGTRPVLGKSLVRWASARIINGHRPIIISLMFAADWCLWDCRKYDKLLEIINKYAASLCVWYYDA